MKKAFFIILLVLGIECALLYSFSFGTLYEKQDSVSVNDALQSIQTNWDHMELYHNPTNLDFVILDLEGNKRYQTKDGLRNNIYDAIRNNDLILDIVVNDEIKGNMIIQNPQMEKVETNKRRMSEILTVLLLIQCLFFIGYICYIYRMILHPFQKLKTFAKHVAAGNLDTPLTMDRKNIFGAFSEAFDIMRFELKQAKQNEAKANAEKKELVAKLSHDIKTPLASIKAVSEVGTAQTQDGKTKDRYLSIIQKADQISTLITNLFHVTLEDLHQLSFHMEDLSASQIQTLLENSDYHHRAHIKPIPDCMIYADQVRLQQVFDNLFSNSYKYANTKIDVEIQMSETHLLICMEDYGHGVSNEELPHLKEKFKRGKNSASLEGAGLGLFISDYFMSEMHGRLLIENGEHGLKTCVMLPLSGKDLRKN